MTDTRLDSASIDQSGPQAALRRSRRRMAAILVVLVILLLIATTLLFWINRPVGTVAEGESAGGLEWVRSIYGWGDARDQQLTTPNDVAFGPDGTIWVTDQSKARIIGFDPDGTYRALLHQGPVGSSQFAFELPVSVTTDEAGDVYIAELANDRVTVVSPDNAVLRQYAVPDPIDVAVRGDRIVVTSRAGFVILEQDGDVVAVVGEEGSGPGQFDAAAGAAIAEDGTIYVTDQYNNRLSAYDEQGDLLWERQMGVPGNQGIGGPMSSTETTAEAAMVLPSRIEIDGAGRLVVADPFDFSLTVLDPENGDLIAKYGSYGEAEGQFTYPNGVAYDAERDWFAVADSANSRVQIVRLPDSGGEPAAAVARALSGPLRALIIPLLLILLAIVGWLVARFVRKRREARAERLAQEALGAASLGSELGTD
jgi:sugar lactone lactonase YvrE